MEKTKDVEQREEEEIIVFLFKDCSGTNQKQFGNTEIISVANTDKWDSESKPIKDDQQCLNWGCADLYSDVLCSVDFVEEGHF